MKVIFLDIDGVLNVVGTIPESALAFHLDPMMVSLVNEITDTTDAKIVISSTWRLMGLDQISTILESGGISGEIIDVTCKEFTAFRRSEEIQNWLDSNEVENYVIIDDLPETGFMKSQQMNFVRTDSFWGITKDDVNQAIGILNNVE